MRLLIETYFPHLKPKPGTIAHRVWSRARPLTMNAWRKIKLTSYTIRCPIDKVRFSFSNSASIKSREFFARESAEEKQTVFKALLSPSKSRSGVIISMVGASRKINNPNNRLDSFLRSVVRTAHHLDRIEVVLRIDKDDDLFFYKAIQDKYGDKICIHFVLGERKGGYLGLHRLVAETLDVISPDAEIVFGVADDCTMWKKHWDDALMEINEQYPDNIFFINTRHDFRLNYESDRMFFWMLWAAGPPSPFTAVGRKVLNITAEIAKKHTDCTAYGNSVMCDSFFETLNYYIWKETGQNREPIIANVIAARIDTVMPDHKEGGSPFKQNQLVINCYTKFLSESTQEIIQEMAREIIGQMELSETDSLKEKPRITAVG